MHLKFSLIIVVQVNFIISGALLLVYSHGRARILADVRKQAPTLATVLAIAGVSAILEDDYLVLQDLAGSISQPEEIRQVMVLNPEGKVLVHNYTAQRGQVYDDSLSRLYHTA